MFIFFFFFFSILNTTNFSIVQISIWYLIPSSWRIIDNIFFSLDQVSC